MTEHVVKVNRSPFDGARGTYTPTCTCGWTGKVESLRRIAVATATRHVELNSGAR